MTRPLPKKLRITPNVGKAILEVLGGVYIYHERSGVQWAEAAADGSDVRIWPDHDSGFFTVIGHGRERRFASDHVRTFRRLIQRAIVHHEREGTMKPTLAPLRHRRHVLGVWLGLDAVEQLAELAEESL